MWQVLKFGEYLKILLKDRGMKPSELACALNVDHSLVRKWLSGARIPSLKSDYFDVICQHLKLSADERLHLKTAQINSIDENVMRLATDLEKAEQRAVENEQALISLLNASTDGVFLLDADYKIVIANEVFAQRLGIPLAQVISKHLDDLLPADMADHRKRYIDQVLDRAQPIRFKDYRDSRCIVNSLYPVLDSRGNVTKVAVYSTDVTELERVNDALSANEEMLRLLYEHSSDPILLTKPDGTILNANPAACSFFQMSEAEICQAGRNNLIDKKAHDILQRHLHERSLTGKLRALLIFIKKDGTRIWAEATSVQFKDSSGTERAYVIIRER